MSHTAATRRSGGTDSQNASSHASASAEPSVDLWTVTVRFGSEFMGVAWQICGGRSSRNGRQNPPPDCAADTDFGCKSRSKEKTTRGRTRVRCLMAQARAHAPRGKHAVVIIVDTAEVAVPRAALPDFAAFRESLAGRPYPATSVADYRGEGRATPVTHGRSSDCA